jgi:hypothetical protein
MYYVVNKHVNLTWVAIYLSTHEHHVIKGRCRDVEQVKALVHDKMSHSLSATPSAIMLVASKYFLSKHLFNEDVEGLVELL